MKTAQWAFEAFLSLRDICSMSHKKKKSEHGIKRDISVMKEAFRCNPPPPWKPKFDDVWCLRTFAVNNISLKGRFISGCSMKAIKRGSASCDLGAKMVDEADCAARAGGEKKKKEKKRKAFYLLISTSCACPSNCTEGENTAEWGKGLQCCASIWLNSIWRKLIWRRWSLVSPLLPSEALFHSHNNSITRRTNSMW